MPVEEGASRADRSEMLRRQLPRHSVVLLVLGLLMLVVGFGYAGTAGRDAERDALHRSLETDASQRARAISDFFERSRAVVLMLARNPALAATPMEHADHLAHFSTTTNDDAEAALAFLERLYPDAIGEACLIDGRGQEHARIVLGEPAGPDELSDDETDNAFFRPSMALPVGVAYQAAPYVSPDTGEWVTSNSTRLAPTRAHPDADQFLVHFEVRLASFAADLLDADRRVQIVERSTGAVVVDTRQNLPSVDATFPVSELTPEMLRSRMVIETGSEASAPAAVRRRFGNANDWVVVVSDNAGLGVFAGFDRLPAIFLTVGLVLVVLAVATRRHHLRLRDLALQDALTGLPNRPLLLDRVETALRAAHRSHERTGILLIDLDRFKEINDTLGHHQGDAVLVEVSRRLRTAVRDSDTIARLGGDEFVVLLPEIDGPDGCFIAARRIHDALRSQYTLDNVPVHLDASIGIAIAPMHGETADQLLQHADVAMYEAKRAGEPSAIYEPERDPYDRTRLTLASELRTAIAAGAIDVHYQAKLDLTTRKIIGFEALARWQHPTRGFVGPDVFIPIAEQTGQVAALTTLVLDRALRQCREWYDLGHEWSVAVNVSARSLDDSEFADNVVAALRAHRVEPQRLVLELTETAIMADPGRSMGVLAALRDAGVSISVDDFGTGYSSLAYLKLLPVSELKIDRSFVRQISTNDIDATIVRSAIDLGHNLGLRIVAEGIEDNETLERLAQLGCDIAQGYLISRPIPAAEVLALTVPHPEVVRNP